MSPTPPPLRDGKLADEVETAAKALLEAVARHCQERQKAEAPPDVLMCIATMALAAEASERDEKAPLNGVARAIASMAIAQGITKHQVVSFLNAAMAPSYASPMARQILGKRGRA